jgi:hypothetical protein
MATTNPPSDELIARAAEDRAGGATWAAVAANLGRSAETVRRWPTLYPERWQAALRDAEVRLAGDAGAEALLTLRQLLRSDDEKVRRDCAQALLRLRFDLTRLGLNTSPDRPAAGLTPEAVRFIAYLDGHPDDELAQLTADLSPPARGPGPGMERPGVGPG